MGDDDTHAYPHALAQYARNASTRHVHGNVYDLNAKTYLLKLAKPDSKTIRQRIEGLIEREYLERDEDSASTYKYLA